MYPSHCFYHLLSLSHTHTLSLSHTHSLSLTHTLSLSHSHTDALPVCAGKRGFRQRKERYQRILTEKPKDMLKDPSDAKCTPEGQDGGGWSTHFVITAAIVGAILILIALMRR